MNLKANIVVLSVLFLGILGTSCVSQKKLTYLRDVTPDMADSINRTFVPQREARIVCGDQLSIIVNAMDVEAVQAFNQPLYSVTSLSAPQISQSGGTLLPYKVDNNGEITYPVLGRIHVEGMTVSELKDTLTTLISQSIKDPLVNVHLQSFNVTVLGEVKAPGQFTFSAERVTIFDALGRAGDMTTYGIRDNVLVTRETNGKLEFARLNLNDASIYSSPFYYLQQNDVVYVQPHKARAVSSQNIPLYLSTLTTLGSLTTVIISVIR